MNMGVGHGENLPWLLRMFSGRCACVRACACVQARACACVEGGSDRRCGPRT